MEVFEPVSPPDTFEASQFGLLSAVNWLPATPHWAGGVQYEADCTDASVTLSPCISGEGAVPPKSATYDRFFRGARSFDTFVEVDCTPTSEWWEIGRTKALRALANSGPVQVERTFWTGLANGGPIVVLPNLTSVGEIFDDTGYILLQPEATVISGGSPLDVTEGLGRVETAFAACYDGVGVLHVPLSLIAALAARALVYRDGNALYTYAGNRVVVGRGYDATYGPDGETAPAGSAWMHMTSPLWGFRGGPRTFDRNDSFDRSVNTLKFIAEQKYLITWNCCLASVLVTTGGEEAGATNSAAES